MLGVTLKNKIVIWGRGVRGKALYHVLGKENVAAFIDNNLPADSYEDCPTISFKDYLNSEYKSFAIVISALNYEQDIINQLQSNGIDFWFLLSEEISELQGNGTAEFIKYLPVPKVKDKRYVIIGTNLYSCIIVEWLLEQGCRNVFLFSEDENKKRGIQEYFGYDFIESLEGVDYGSCIIATREPFLKHYQFDKMVDFFDLSELIPEYWNQSLFKYESIHAGERCFLIGNGPSLLLSDVLKCGQISTFGTNRIYRLSDEWKPDYFVCADLKVLEDEMIYKYDVKTKFFSEQAKCRLPDGSEWLHVSHVFSEDRGFPVPFSNDISKRVYSGANVIYMAMQIAVYMGFSEIYLLGVDCEYPKDKPSHFYGDDFDAGGDPQWNRSMNTFKSAKKYADTHGIKIYNATRGGALEVFERVDFDSLNFLK